MSDITSAFEGMSPGLLVALGVLVVVELVLLVSALVSLVRRPAEALNGPRWLWVVVIVFINTIGPIVYFLFGRKPQQVDVSGPPREDQAGRTESVANVLYGDAPPKDQDR